MEDILSPDGNHYLHKVLTTFSFFSIVVTALLQLPLKLYQEEGVKWMLSREKGPAVSGVQGGILGDDMG